MAKKKVAVKKESRKRSKGGFAIFRETVLHDKDGTPDNEMEAMVVTASELKNQLDCETWLKANAEVLDPASVYVIVQLKKTVRVSVETIKKVTVK